MRYSELNITTQRQAPARARTEGEAMLKRAGYLLASGQLTPLGRRARATFDGLAQAVSPVEFFARLALPIVKTQGGEYCYTISAGKVEVLRCEACGYASLRPTASFRKPIPAAESAAPLERVPTPECNTIEALAHFLGMPEERTAKALMYTRTADNRFVFVVVRGDMQLSEAKLQAQVGVVRPATADEIVAAGAAPGYASPIGLEKALVAVDDLIPPSPNLVAGANEAGFHLKNTNYGRDYRAEIVADLVIPEPEAACPNCGHPMELLHTDLLGTPGGYDLDAVLEALAQAHHDEKGLTLPPEAAPFDVYLLHVPGKELDTRAQAALLHEEWQHAGIRVLLDDRDERAGVKFADADLIGIPMRATVGERGMKDGMVELKPRLGRDILLMPFSDAASSLRSLNKAP